MATRKKAPQSGKKTTRKTTKARKSKAAMVGTGPVPPYGDPIRGAISRGDVQEMRNLAASSRKWLADVQAALAQLESAIKKSGS